MSKVQLKTPRWRPMPPLASIRQNQVDVTLLRRHSSSKQNKVPSSNVNAPGFRVGSTTVASSSRADSVMDCTSLSRFSSLKSAGETGSSNPALFFGPAPRPSAFLAFLERKDLKKVILAVQSQEGDRQRCKGLNNTYPNEPEHCLLNCPSSGFAPT